MKRKKCFKRIHSIYLYSIIEPSPNPIAINVRLVWTHRAVAGTAR